MRAEAKNVDDCVESLLRQLLAVLRCGSCRFTGGEDTAMRAQALRICFNEVHRDIVLAGVKFLPVSMPAALVFALAPCQLFVSCQIQSSLCAATHRA